ncbi:MAG: hypothetical protein OHK0015_37160 [Chloroflexi bacterium OHK40]
MEPDARLDLWLRPVEGGVTAYQTDVELTLFFQPAPDATLFSASALAVFDTGLLGALEGDEVAYGQALTRMLFGASEAGAFMERVHDRLTAGQRLVVRLFLEEAPPGLRALAWERLCDPRGGVPLARLGWELRPGDSDRLAVPPPAPDAPRVEEPPPAPEPMRGGDGPPFQPDDSRGELLVEPSAAEEGAYLNTRFEGYEDAPTLPLRRWVPLVVAVGPRLAERAGERSAPFGYRFAGADPVAFSVTVAGQPEAWEIRPAEETMLVVPPAAGAPAHTEQEATFLLRARLAGQHKLYLRVAQQATGTVVQDLWLSVVASEAAISAGQPAPAPVTGSVRVSHPIDLETASPHRVRLVFAAEDASASGFALQVEALLPDWQLIQRFRLPVSGAELQSAAGRLRRALAQIVHVSTPDAPEPLPFCSSTSLTIPEPVMRQAALELADVGRQVWELLFSRGSAAAELRAFARRLRQVPPGTVLDLVLENPQFGLPWALLYDQPGDITAETLSWAGFWGHRFDLRIHYPGDYPGPLIGGTPLRVLMACHDDPTLRAWAAEQQALIDQRLGERSCAVVAGREGFLSQQRSGVDAQILYTFCHGQRSHLPGEPLPLPSEAALVFGSDAPARVTDLRRLELDPLPQRPLVFINACEGATRDPLYYDNFVSYFIGDRHARGCIGTEVIVPRYLAHQVALAFFDGFTRGESVGPLLWRLRRQFLAEHHNLLVFNYTLYGNGDMRLAAEAARP